jgi:predicted transcriptional regulator
MEYSEIFLIVWATIATVLAIAFHQIAKRQKIRLFMMEFSLHAIAHKKAEVIIEGDNIRVKEV